MTERPVGLEFDAPQGICLGSMCPAFERRVNERLVPVLSYAAIADIKIDVDSGGDGTVATCIQQDGCLIAENIAATGDSNA